METIEALRTQWDLFFNNLIQSVALIHLQTHSIMNLVVGEGDVILEDVIPAS